MNRRVFIPCLALSATLLASALAAHAQRAEPPAPISQPQPVPQCPDDSARICTPHGCYCS